MSLRLVPLAVLLAACEAAPDGPQCGPELDFVPDPASALVVSNAGDDAATGTCDDPLASVGEAVDRLRQLAAGGVVAVLPGSYPESLFLTDDPVDGGSHDGIDLLGAGRDDVELTASDLDFPLLQIDGELSVGALGMTLVGGLQGLVAGSSADVLFSDLAVEGAAVAGIVIHGHDTIAAVDDVQVQTGSPLDDLAYGVVVDASTLTGSALTITGEADASLLASGAATGVLDLAGLVVDGGSSASGFRRGVQLQGLASAAFQDPTISGVADAGVFALAVRDLQIDAPHITGVAAGEADGEPTGDGIVVTAFSEAGPVDPADYPTTITDGEVLATDRDGILLEQVAFAVSGVDAEGEVFYQGPEPVPPGTGAVPLDPADARSLDRSALSLPEPPAAR